jgi:hypothetical protein
VLAGAAVWAVAAVLAPLLVRGRSVALDALLGAAWAVMTVAGTDLVARALAGGTPQPAPRGAVIGGVVGGLVLVAPVLLTRSPGAFWAARVPDGTRRVA